VNGTPKDASQALAWYQRAGAGNVAKAQSQLGFMHHEGEGGLAIDHAEAVRFYALAATQGLACAEFNLGCCYRDGSGVPRNLVEAARLFCLAADQGDADAQASLANLYMCGLGVLQDFSAAMIWARRSADQGSARGEHLVGILYDNGDGVPCDLRAASSWYARAAKQGDENSKTNLRNLASRGVPEAAAALYSLGLNAPLRAEDAAVVTAGGCPLGDVEAQQAAIDSWGRRPLAAIREAAEGGELSAQYVLGVCFRDGLKSASKDAAQAMVWHRRAAAGNVVLAQLSLASMHADGVGGLAVDLNEAARLCYKAIDKGPYPDACPTIISYAERGSARAQALVAFLYINGRKGLECNYAAALKYAQLSADQGFVLGEFNLATMHHVGRGVPVDLHAAAKWYARAAEHGNKQAPARLRALAAKGVAKAAEAVERLKLTLNSIKEE